MLSRRTDSHRSWALRNDKCLPDGSSAKSMPLFQWKATKPTFVVMRCLMLSLQHCRCPTSIGQYWGLSFARTLPGLAAHLRKAHVNGTHCFQGTYAATVAEREFCDLAFCRSSPLTPCFNWNAKHVTCAFINIAVACEDIHAPLFAGQEGQHPGLDCGEVGYHIFISGFGMKLVRIS